jgi:REP element-mobilizing transposase RayT
MSRSLRLEFPGALFHVTQRGNYQQDIFVDDHDRRFFLELLGKCANRYGWILMAYVLMSNHFHLVVQLTCSTLSRGMQWFGTKYVQAFNRRHGRVGHLFQGPFDAPLVEKEIYGLNVLRYDVLNPVRAGMVARPEDYIWSSHRAVLGMAPAPEWLAIDDVLVQFAPQRDLARTYYKSFVDAAIGIDENPWKDLVAGNYLGSKDWVAELREEIDLKPRADDHERFQRVVGQPSMAAVVAGVAECLSIDPQRVRYGRGSTPRRMAAWIACNDALLTNREIAAGLRLRSSGHISDLVRRFDRELTGNAVLQGWVERCISTIRRKSGKPKVSPNSSS